MLNVKSLLGIDWKQVKVLDILQGCAEHYLSDYLGRGEAFDKVIKYRLSFCKSCPLYEGGVCDTTKQIRHVTTGLITSGCGCSVNCKTALKSSECPAGKWKAID